MKRAALLLAALLLATSARSDGIFNPGGRGIPAFEGPFNGGAPAPAPPSTCGAGVINLSAGCTITITLGLGP